MMMLEFEVKGQRSTSQWDQISLWEF